MIPTGDFLALGAVLFCIGAAGVLVRRNVLVALMSVELMLNAANLTLLAFSRERGDTAGQGLAFLTIAVAASEAAVGLAIVVAVFRTRRTVGLDEARLLREP
jgi:NADH-quinone oxidoreductase subunit K